MRTVHWRDQAGVRWHEIVGETKSVLEEKKEMLERKGYKCWLDNYGDYEFVLTVRDNEASVFAA